ncbi:MAG: DUF4870 domain-containing protein [Anaerolineales bacterium]|nr:DUF4870 domain-containing protein [Anaerolineales bacterium]
MSEHAATPAYSSEERIMGAISHAGIILAATGLIAPIIVWITQREKSRFARFQALQALAYQLGKSFIYLAALLLAFILTFGLIAIEFLKGNPVSRTATPDLYIFTQVLGLIILFSTMALVILLGLIGSIACLAGKDFHYPLLGKWIQTYLDNTVENGAQEDTNEPNLREDQLIAVLSHAGFLIPFWGVIVPVILWFSEKNRSALLRFQSLQAAIFQLTSIFLIYFSFGCYVLSVFVPALISNANYNLALTLVEIGSNIINLMFLIGGPLYLLFGCIAVWRVSKGYDYRYPLLGKLTKKLLNHKQNAQSITIS